MSDTSNPAVMLPTEPAPAEPPAEAAPPAPAAELSLDLSGVPTEAVVGADYVGQAKASGGVEPHTYRLLGNPPHKINPETGEITFTPVVAMAHTVTVEATDSADPPASVAESVAIAAKVPEPPAAA